MTKQEQIALLNKTNVTKIELINEINAHLNVHPNYMPIHGGNNQLTRKMKIFCTSNLLTPLNLNFFVKSLPTSLKSNNANWWSSGNPQNDIIVVADQNKKKYLCVVRGGGVPTLLDINTKITTPTIKNIFKSFVISGIDSSSVIRSIKKIQLRTCELNEQMKGKVYVNYETNESLNINRYIEFKFDVSTLSFHYRWKTSTFNKNSGKLNNSPIISYNTVYQLSQIENKIDEFEALGRKKEVDKEKLLFYVNQNYEKRLNTLKAETENAIQTISTFCD